MEAERIWNSEPDIQAFLQGSRLNILRGLAGRQDDSELKAAMAMIAEHHEAAVKSLQRLSPP